MSLSIKKSSKSGEVQRIINEEMERLGAVQGLNQMQLEERDKYGGSDTITMCH